MSVFTIPIADNEKTIPWNKIVPTISFNETQVIKGSSTKTYHKFDFTQSAIELARPDKTYTTIDPLMDSASITKLLVAQTLAKIPNSIVPRMTDIAGILGLSGLNEVDLKILCLNLIVLSYCCDLRRTDVKVSEIVKQLKAFQSSGFIASPIFSHLRIFATQFFAAREQPKPVDCSALLGEPSTPASAKNVCKNCKQEVVGKFADHNASCSAKKKAKPCFVCKEVHFPFCKKEKKEGKPVES